MRKCSKCKQAKELTEFHKSYTYWCKECKRENYLVTKEKHQESMKKWRENNQQYSRERKKERAAEDPVFKKRVCYAQLLLHYFKLYKHDVTRYLPQFQCTVIELRTHLNETFVINYNREPQPDDIIEINHVVSQKTAKSLIQLSELQHYKNLQLLLKKDNRNKTGFISNYALLMKKG